MLSTNYFYLSEFPCQLQHRPVEDQQSEPELAGDGTQHSQHKLPIEHDQLPQERQNGPLGRKFM